jgi:antitoxin (DNA-binding transcriptional repressor) of toxin-antitoxin stability system
MKTMQMREFLRGGYKNIKEMTLITNHGNPVATWMPQTHAKKREYPLSAKMVAGVDSKIAHDPEHGE